MISSQKKLSSGQYLSANILYMASAILSGLGLLGKSSLLAKFTHLPYWVTVPVVFTSLCACLFWPLALRFRKILAPLICAFLFAFFLFVFPRMEDLHKQGRGSDQADCVIVAADRLLAHSWPYEPSDMSSKNAMSCGPGWIAWQAPAIGLVGYSWNLVLCWAISLGALAYKLGWDRTAGIITLIGLSPGAWLTAANGSDFLTFGIVLVAFLAFIGSGTTKRSSWFWPLAALILGLIAQFRVVTLLIPAFFTKQLNRATVLAAWAIATAIQIGFLLWNPQGFVNRGPLHIAAKLMRTSVISDRPAIAALELGLASLLGFVVLFFLAKTFHLKQPLLLFLLFVFVVPGLQDFLIKYHRYGHVLRGLEFWEGGMWIVACVPLAAAGLLVAARKAEVDPASSGVVEELVSSRL